MRARCGDGLALGCLLLASWLLGARGQVTAPVKALTGGQAGLSISNLTTQYQDLTWLYSNKKKLVIRDDRGIKYYKYGLGERVCLDGDNTLHIRNLQRNDSGEYVLQLLKMDGTTEERRLRLQVLDPVSTPTITIQDLRPRDSDCFLNLSCLILAQHSQVTIAWSGPKGPLKQGPSLEVTVPIQEMPVSYTCQASDTLSSSHSTVTFARCLTGKSPEELALVSWLLVLVPLVLQALLT
ncbi:CD48 antigen [Sorex araneus]|uniref:CD48 antigen n=1 Tax=Sorex araneus TaxID=42254 RepID=UPI0003317324|nr:CD48 antigen [Sorex araneus]